MRVEFGVQFHLPTQRDFTVPDIVELGGALATAGVSQLWVTDNLKERHPFVVLSALAAELPVKLGIAVMVQYFRNPVDSARAIASISEMMDGRELSVGLGYGSPGTSDLVAVVKPIRVMRELSQCLRALLTGETVTFKDYPSLATYFNIVPDAEFRLDFFTPKTPISLYCGGNGPMSLRIGGANMDGLIVGPYFQLFARAGRLPAMFETFDEAASNSGRVTPARRVAELKLSVSRDADTAREFIRRKAGRMVSTVRRGGYGDRYSDEETRRLGFGLESMNFLEEAGGDLDLQDPAAQLVSDDMIDAAYVAGDPAYCRDRIAEIRAKADEFGFEQLMFSELGPDTSEAVRILCDDILPELS